MKLCLSFAFAFAAAAFARDASTAPVQPIAFSHSQHIGAAHLKCSDCHKPSESGEIETTPKAKACMTCHQTIKTDSAEIKNLRDYADSNRPVPWVRVYEVPAFVDFSHKVHLDAGTSCETCHGPVAQRNRLWRETDISMNGCVSCHRAHKAPVECGTCHDLQH